MIKSKAVYPQASLECSECNEEVYTCEDCGSYLEEGEIYCGEDYNIHYCKTCGDGLEYRRKEKEKDEKAK